MCITLLDDEFALHVLPCYIVYISKKYGLKMKRRGNVMLFLITELMAPLVRGVFDFYVLSL